jgi:hypothetical protein
MTNPSDPDLYLVGAKPPKTAMNVSIDARVFEAFEAWVRETRAAKGAAASLAIQRFLESKGVHIPGVSPSPE